MEQKALNAWNTAPDQQKAFVQWYGDAIKYYTEVAAWKQKFAIAGGKVQQEIDALKAANEKLEQEKQDCERRLSSRQQPEIKTDEKRSFASVVGGAVGSVIGGAVNAFRGSSQSQPDVDMKTQSDQPEVETKTGPVVTQPPDSTLRMGKVIKTTPKEVFESVNAPYHLRQIEWDDGKSNDPAGYYGSIRMKDGQELVLDEWGTVASMLHYRDDKPTWSGHPLDRYYDDEEGETYKVPYNQTTQLDKSTLTATDDFSNLTVTHNGKTFPAMEFLSDPKLSSKRYAIFDKWATADPKNKLGPNEVLYYGFYKGNPGWFKRTLTGVPASDQWGYFGAGKKVNTATIAARFGDRVGLSDTDIGYSARKRKRHRY